MSRSNAQNVVSAVVQTRKVISIKHFPLFAPTNASFIGASLGFEWFGEREKESRNLKFAEGCYSIRCVQQIRTRVERVFDQDWLASVNHRADASQSCRGQIHKPFRFGSLWA